MGASLVRATPSGHLLLGRQGQLMAMPFAAADGGPAADAVPVVRDVGGVTSSGILYFDVSDNGTLVFAERNPQATSFELTWVSRDGRAEALPLPPREYRVPRISPDGSQLAVGIGPGRGRQSDIWIHDLVRGSMTRLTFDNLATAPVWNHDGTRITFATAGDATGGGSIAWKAADGSDAAETLVSFEDSVPRAPLDWNAGDEELLFQSEGGAGSGVDLLVLSRADAAVRPFATTEAIELTGALSPDGRWVAYSSDESGRLEVYVESFQDKGGRWQISDGSGIAPRWSRDGTELYYASGLTMMAAKVRTTPTFSHGQPVELFEMPFMTTAETFANFDVGPDGRFVVVRATAGDSTAHHFNLVLGWFGELGEAVPVD